VIFGPVLRRSTREYEREYLAPSMELVDHEHRFVFHDLLDKEGGADAKLLESSFKAAS